MDPKAATPAPTLTECAVLVDRADQFSADFTLCRQPTEHVDETYKLPVCKGHQGDAKDCGVTVWDSERSVFVGLGVGTKFVKEGKTK